MQRLSLLTDQEKRDALRKAIRRKCRFGISDCKLDFILKQLNVNRPHSIKTTSDPSKFLNFATVETVATPERKMISNITTLYGDVECGHFFKDEHKMCSASGMMRGDADAAILKRTILQQKDQPISITYMLILYERQGHTQLI